MTTTSITLDNPGDRLVPMTAEMAQELIETRWNPLFATTDSTAVVHVLDLECRVYPVPAATILCDYLSDKVEHVHTAVLNDIIASLPTDEGLAVVGLFTELLTNSPLLSKLQMNDNALGIRGIEILSPILSCPNLVSLSLENDGLSKESMRDLKEAFATTGHKLEEFNIYNNMIGKEGAMDTACIIAKCRKLRVLRYEGCRPGPEGMQSLVEGILEMVQAGGGKNLETLILEGTLGSTKEEAVGTLCRALSQMPNLKELRLYDGDLLTAGSKLVLESLRHLTNTLVSLDLSQNEIGAKVIPALVVIIQNNAATLKTLSLESNELYSVGVERLMTAAFDETDVVLEELGLKENYLGVRGAQALIASKSSMPRLKALTLYENFFPQRTIDRLLECFGDDIILTDGPLVAEDDGDDDMEEESDEEEESDDDDDDDDDVDDLAGALGKAKIGPSDVSL